MSRLVRPLRERLARCMDGGKFAEAAELLRELERLDFRERSRWAHRLGDLERRRGRHVQARAAYVRAARGYRDAGHEGRAEALKRALEDLRAS